MEPVVELRGRCRLNGGKQHSGEFKLDSERMKTVTYGWPLGWRRAGRSLALLSALWVLQGCASLVGSVTQNFANDLGTAILESDDPHMVRDERTSLFNFDRLAPGRKLPKTRQLAGTVRRAAFGLRRRFCSSNLSVRKNSI